MQNLHKSAVMLSPNDSTALEMAVEKVRSTVRAGELADLIDERGWQSAAMVAALPMPRLAAPRMGRTAMRCEADR